MRIEVYIHNFPSLTYFKITTNIIYSIPPLLLSKRLLNIEILTVASFCKAVIDVNMVNV